MILSDEAVEILAGMATTAKPDLYLKVESQAELDRLVAQDRDSAYKLLKQFPSWLLVEKIPRVAIQ